MTLSHFWTMDLVALERTPRILKRLTEIVDEEVWYLRPLADHFTAAEGLHHLAEMEVIHLERYRRIAEQEMPELPNHDPQVRLDTNAYAGKTIAEGLAMFAEARAETLRYLKELSRERIARQGVHPDYGAMSLEDQVRKSVAHDVVHLEDILARTADAK